MKVGDKYMVFDPEIVNNVNWLSLKITTRLGDEVVEKKKEKQTTCSVCKKNVEPKMAEAECEHVFHDECAQIAKSLKMGCSVCLS